MNIIVSGDRGSRYRFFNFPGALFNKHVGHMYAHVHAEPSASRWVSDLTPRARLLAVEILALGGLEKVEFRPGQVSVRAFNSDQLPSAVINQIKDIINKHFGTPQPERVIYLPFGLKLVLPPK